MEESILSSISTSLVLIVALQVILTFIIFLFVKKMLCRTGIIPSTDHRFIESDYGSQEVRIAGCYTEDPAWIDYIITPGADMHRDCAAETFLLPKEQVTSTIRFFSKNQWVFPQLYGSWYKNCAKNLWNTVVVPGLKTVEGRTVKEHLRSKDISTYTRFEEHCRKYERRYWNKFKKTKQWQEKVIRDYATKGYVTTYFGHRRSGYLKMNEIINTPIQATAFHCLLWSCNRCDDIARDENWESELLSQVHDSMKFDAYPPEQEMVVETVQQVAEIDIREENDWIIVPLVMEFEFTPINGNWYTKEEVEVNKQGDFVGVKSGKIYDLNY
jgi:DNA polymerase I-like protein with 3'-5' exonuclease and polymerase domains